jgi:hypothetical protein
MQISGGNLSPSENLETKFEEQMEIYLGFRYLFNKKELQAPNGGILRSILSINRCGKNKCQPKHKVFYWLWLKNRLNTRNMLRRKNITLESYSYENCIWQKEKTLYDLFLRCNFAKAC